MDAAWIESTEALSAWVAALPDGPLAVDTEADSFHHYREKVCLLQLSARDAHALVDPLASVDLAPLRAPFANASIRKLLHGADYDIRLLTRDFDLAITGLSDTMIAARLCGEPALGLAALLATHLGVTLDKAHQRADWSKRPLPAALRAYAVDDTRHLPRLAAIFDRKLEELGRTAWMREECERLESVRWRDRGADDPEAYRRTKGAKSLDRLGLSVLREVWLWRDEAARRRDRPHFRVLRDETLVAVAKAPPATIGELARISGIPDSLVRSPSANDLLTAVGRGVSCPEGERPSPRVDVRERLEPAVESRVAVIKQRRDEVARSLALDPAVVAPRGVMEDLAKRIESGEDPWQASELRRWQAGVLRPVLGSF
jgi:ribonuclease D